MATVTVAKLIADWELLHTAAMLRGSLGFGVKPRRPRKKKAPAEAP